MNSGGLIVYKLAGNRLRGGHNMKPWQNSGESLQLNSLKEKETAIAGISRKATILELKYFNMINGTYLIFKPKGVLEQNKKHTQILVGYAPIELRMKSSSSLWKNGAPHVLRRKRQPHSV
jgi:hypothetical protein